MKDETHPDNVEYLKPNEVFVLVDIVMVDIPVAAHCLPLENLVLL